MADRPRRIEDYRPEETARVRQVCLSLASVLGDLVDDIVIVGGLVPTLLIPEHSPESSLGAHSGTVDLDVGMSVGILDEERYQEIHERLILLGLQPDKNEQGNTTHQRWVAGEFGVTIDFLIPATDPGDKPGTLRHLDREFAAIITPGLELAFEQRHDRGRNPQGRISQA